MNNYCTSTNCDGMRNLRNENCVNGFRVGDPKREMHTHLTHPHHKNHLPPHLRNNLVSIQFDNQKMQDMFGENYIMRIEHLEKEPPEMKIIFALTMGFNIVINQEMVQFILEDNDCGIAVKFDIFTEAQIDMLSQKIGTNPKELSAIINPIPEGIATIILSLL